MTAKVSEPPGLYKVQWQSNYGKCIKILALPSSIHGDYSMSLANEEANEIHTYLAPLPFPENAIHSCPSLPHQTHAANLLLRFALSCTQFRTKKFQVPVC